MACLGVDMGQFWPIFVVDFMACLRDNLGVL